MYHIVADMHTHSIASTHAYSTIAEMADAAREKGLDVIAITDHAKLMPGAPGPWYFGNLGSSIPLRYRGVTVLAGIEANVTDFNGTLDIEPADLPVLDWVVASIHAIGLPGLENPTLEKCTQLWLGVAANPAVHVIGHSGDPRYSYDIDTVIPAFGRAGKLVEINSHSFEARPQNIETCRKIAQACMRYEVPIVVNSDAHIETDVANLTKALHMLEEMDFPEALIVNADMNRLTAYLRTHSTVFERRGG